MKITFTGGSRIGEQVDLDEGLKSTGSVMLGRSHECDVRLVEPDINRRHLEVRLGANEVHAVCHGNLGFKLNDEVIGKGEHQVLKTGDVVVLGSSVSFRVEDDCVTDNGGGVTDEELGKVRKLIAIDETGKAMGLLRGMLAKGGTNIQKIVLYGMCCQIHREYWELKRIQDRITSWLQNKRKMGNCDEDISLVVDWIDECKTQAEIKQMLVDGEVVKARDALKEQLTRKPENLFAKMLLGACSLLIDDEGTFKGIYSALKSVMERKEGKVPKTMDALLVRYWHKYCRAFEILYAKKGNGMGQWFREYDINKLKNKQTLKSVFFLAVVCAVFSASGDVLPNPLMSDFPLHRIGIEFVLTSIAGALGGGIATRWLIKRGWKFEKKLSQAERYSMECKLNAVLPKLLRCSVGMRLCNDLGIGVEHRVGDGHSGIEFVLQQNPDLVKDLDGVPIEWAVSRTESLYLNKQHEWYNSKSRTRYEKDLYFMGGLGLGNDYCASSEEMSEWNDNVRKNWHSPSEVMFETRRRRRWIIFSIIIGLILMLMGLVLLFSKKCN